MTTATLLIAPKSLVSVSSSASAAPASDWRKKNTSAGTTAGMRKTADIATEDRRGDECLR